MSIEIIKPAGMLFQAVSQESFNIGNLRSSAHVFRWQFQEKPVVIVYLNGEQASLQIRAESITEMQDGLLKLMADLEEMQEAYDKALAIENEELSA